MGKFFGGAGKDGDSTETGGEESELVSALGEICQKYDKDLSELTWTQFYMYMDALGLDRMRQFKSDATAARLAQATGEDWQRFMDGIEKGQNDDTNSRLEQIDKAMPEPEPKEDGITWLKFNSQ